MEKEMNRHLVALAMLGVSLVMALAYADGDGEREVSPLKKIMRAQNKYSKAAYQAVQQKKQAALQAAAKSLLDAGKKLGDTAPDDLTSKDDKEAWAKFSKDLGEKVQALVDAANKTGGGSYWKDVDDARTAVGESCKACHDVFNKDEGK